MAPSDVVSWSGKDQSEGRQERVQGWSSTSPRLSSIWPVRERNKAIANIRSCISQCQRVWRTIGKKAGEDATPPSDAWPGNGGRKVSLSTAESPVQSQ